MTATRHIAQPIHYSTCSWRWCTGVACLALLLLSPSPAAADPAEGQAAAPLTVDSDTWTEAIIESPQPAFVYYRGTHGGPGDESIMKQLAELASKHSGISVVALVECSDKGKGDALCRDASLTRVPAMKVYAAQKKRNPYTRAWWKESVDYTGQLTARAMSMALQSQLVDASITRVRSLADWENWVDQDTLPKVLVFTDKEKVSLLIRGLAMHYTDRLAFAYVDPSVVELLDEFQVTDAPAVRLRKVSGDVVVYEGAVNAVDMQAWLSKYAPERIVDEVNRKNLEDTAPIFDHAPRYRNLTVSQVTPLLATSEDIWLLVFARKAALDAPSDCSDSLAAFAAAVRHAGEIFQIGLVALEGEGDAAIAATFLGSDIPAETSCALPLVFLECQHRADLLPYDRQVFRVGNSNDLGKVRVPQLRIKPFGESKDASDLETFDGAIGDKALLTALYDLLPEMTTHMSQEAMPAFIGMTPGGISPFTPKIILGTRKRTVPGLFRALAVNFRRRDLAFGWYSEDLDPEIAQQFGGGPLPRVFAAFVDPSNPPDASGQVPLGLQPFTMPLKYTYLENFLEAVADRHGRAGNQGGVEDDKEEFSGSVRHEVGPLPQLHSDAELDAACTALGGVCLIALLDATSPDALQGHLNTLEGVRSTRRNNAVYVRRDQPIHFMWVDAASQPTFSAALGIDPSDAPTVALLSPRRLRVARLTTRFTRDAVSQLIDRVLNAQVATAPLGVLPVLVEGGEAAAGSGEEAVEEEFDLSEIMGEAVDELDDRTARLEAAMLEVETEAAAAKQRDAEAQAAIKAQKKAKKKKKRSKAKRASDGAHDEL